MAASCRHVRAGTALVLLSAVAAAALSPPTAVAATVRQPNCAKVTTDLIAGFVTEAAARFGVPESWIRAVMRIESGGDRCIISPAGAQGLMQLMPRTYAELKARYGLGADPFDPRDNILAGAAYLREMWDRFGPSGFLAAYNAGPGRYQDHLVTGRPLSSATTAYVAALAPAVGGAPTRGVAAANAQPPSLFVQIDGNSAAAEAAPAVQHESAPEAQSAPASLQASGLFAAVSDPVVQR